jgi:DivIVA domain-containing protein
VGDHQGFTVVLRGYDVSEVDDYLRRAIDRLA